MAPARAVHGRLSGRSGTFFGSGHLPITGIRPDAAMANTGITLLNDVRPGDAIFKPSCIKGEVPHRVAYPPVYTKQFRRSIYSALVTPDI